MAASVVVPFHGACVVLGHMLGLQRNRDSAPAALAAPFSGEGYTRALHQRAQAGTLQCAGTDIDILAADVVIRGHEAVEARGVEVGDDPCASLLGGSF